MVREISNHRRINEPCWYRFCQDSRSDDRVPRCKYEMRVSIMKLVPFTHPTKNIRAGGSLVSALEYNRANEAGMFALAIVWNFTVCLGVQVLPEAIEEWKTYPNQRHSRITKRAQKHYPGSADFIDGEGHCFHSGFTRIYTRRIGVINIEAWRD